MTYGYCVYHEIECDYKGDCIDCSHNTIEDIEWFKQDEKREESEGMTRKEAIKILKSISDISTQGEAIDMAIDALQDRPQGEWISNHDGSWNCSECGLRVFIYAKGNYCPNCGARMTLYKGDDDK